MHLSVEEYCPDDQLEGCHPHQDFYKPCNNSLHSGFPYVVTAQGIVLLQDTIALFNSNNLAQPMNELNKEFYIIRQMIKRSVPNARYYKASKADLLDVISRTDESENSESVVTEEEDNQASMILQQILGKAIQQKASDVHIRLYGKKATYYFRVHGSKTPENPIGYSLMNRALNHLVNMKITNEVKLKDKKSTIQGTTDYKIKLDDGSIVEKQLRISKIPVEGGEKTVIRINDTDESVMQLDDFKYNDITTAFLKLEVEKPYGLCLVTGPTGSGKTSLLCALVSAISPEKQRNSVEDPVEIKIPDVDQASVIKGVEGASFDNLLEAMLRQDPDVLMLGEVRNGDVANKLLSFTRTGHFTLSTLHVNSASQVPERLMDLGVEFAALRSTLSSLIAVRLLRTLCPECKVSVSNAELEHEQRQKLLTLDKDISKFYLKNPVGCKTCLNTGISGRRSVIEYISVQDEDYEYIFARDIKKWEKYLKEKRGWLSMADRTKEFIIEGIADPFDSAKIVEGIFDDE